VTSNDGTVPPVDLDLLADYLDDLLPTGPAAMVARRIETDARWASAAEQLRAATPAVTDTLRATHTEPMPDAVFDRFLAALPDPARTRAIAGETAGTVPAGSDLRAGGNADARRGQVISLDHRRRRSLWSDLAKVAAAVVVVAGIGTGIGLGVHASTSGTKSSTSAASNAEGTPQRGAAGGVVTQVTVSGHDYGGELTVAPTAPLPRVQSKAVPTPNTPGGERAPSFDSQSVPGAPSALQRLANGGLPACLAQVQDQFGTMPLKADFAFYAGTPAVVITLSNGMVVAVGADCGLPGEGARVLATGH
jgi:hypothetical protein